MSPRRFGLLDKNPGLLIDLNLSVRTKPSSRVILGVIRRTYLRTHSLRAPLQKFEQSNLNQLLDYTMGVQLGKKLARFLHITNLFPLPNVEEGMIHE